MEQELDTFDDGPYTDGPMLDNEGVEAHNAEAEEGQVTEEEAVQAQETEDIDPDSQVALLEENTGEEGEKKAEKKADKPDEGDEAKDAGDDEPESKDGTPEDAGEPKEEVRTLKAFRDGKRYEIPEDAELKVKVDGKNEKVTLTELRDNYAGKVAWDKKFSEFSEEKKGWEETKNLYDAEMEVIKEHFVNLRTLTEKGMQGEVDPVSSMNYLLDLMGINTVDYNKAVFEHMAEEFDLYSQMTESEREALWTKRENEYLVKRQESLTRNQSEEKARVEFQRKVEGLREAHGISEEDYVSAENDLKDMGFKDFNPEQVVEAARLKPLIATADELLEPYLEQLSDEEAHNASVEIATTMLRTPELTVDQVKTMLAEMYEVEDIMSTIESKVGQTETPAMQAPKREPNHIESFDDFDYY